MGLVRLIFIGAGIAVCSELPADDGVSFFRSYVAFFVMLALDYYRMATKGVSTYEKIIGVGGFLFTLFQAFFCWLGTSKQIVLDKTAAEYVIVSSKTFGLLPHLYWPIHSYMMWTAYLTAFIAGFELTIQFVNRFSKKQENDDVDSEVTIRPKFRWMFWRQRKQHPGVEIHPNVPETITGGGK